MSPNFTFKSLFKNTFALLNKLPLPSHLCGIFCDHVRISVPLPTTNKYLIKIRYLYKNNPYIFLFDQLVSFLMILNLLIKITTIGILHNNAKNIKK